MDKKITNVTIVERYFLQPLLKTFFDTKNITFSNDMVEIHEKVVFYPKVVQSDLSTNLVLFKILMSEK